MALPPRRATLTSARLDSPVTALALALVVAGVASTVVALAQTFELWEGSQWIARMPGLQRHGGNLSQPNHLATLLMMALASVVFLHESKSCPRCPGGLVVLCSAWAWR